MKFGPIALAIAIVAGGVAGMFVQLIYTASVDCGRDAVAFADACEFGQDYPTLTRVFGR